MHLPSSVPFTFGIISFRGARRCTTWTRVWPPPKTARTGGHRRYRRPLTNQRNSVFSLPIFRRVIAPFRCEPGEQMRVVYICCYYCRAMLSTDTRYHEYRCAPKREHSQNDRLVTKSMCLRTTINETPALVVPAGRYTTCGIHSSPPFPRTVRTTIPPPWPLPPSPLGSSSLS